MFNRRHLRIKALQAVYNYSQKEKVAYNLGMDVLDEFFAPDLNSMELPNRPLLDKNKKEAKKIFEEQYKLDRLDFSGNDEVKKGITSAKTTYINYLKEERKYIKESIQLDVDNVWFNYLSVVKFLEDLTKQIAYVYENNEQKRMKAVLNKSDFKLGYTKVFEEVYKVDEYVTFVNKHKFAWQDDDSLIKNFYRETLIKEDRYKEYLLEEASDESDAGILLSICKKLLWKNAQVREFFEEQDPFWHENFEIISELLIKSFKKLKKGEGFELIHLSPNWDSDFEYMMNLFDKAIEFPVELTERLRSKLSNWDLERVSNVDKHILELAIVEMIECPSIPTKVTINEFLEITKEYSSPKSKLFVNGILDTLAKELIEDKIIRKSGRGLIDNK
jgi:transcription antitermination protein NusB